jgi:hypothetical protein
MALYNVPFVLSQYGVVYGVEAPDAGAAEEIVSGMTIHRLEQESTGMELAVGEIQGSFHGEICERSLDITETETDAVLDTKRAI